MRWEQSAHTAGVLLSVASRIRSKQHAASLFTSRKPDWFGLVWFCGISTIVGYLMPNHLYTYILNTVEPRLLKLFVPKLFSTTDLFENWDNVVRVDSASRSVMFGLPWQLFARVPFSSVRLVYSNSEHLFDQWGIFYPNILLEHRIVQFERRSITEVSLYTICKHILLIIFFKRALANSFTNS